MNPRYTGYQVWNKQRKDEVLLDVEDVALGHTTKQRWNPRDRWVFSDKIVHPVIIEMDVFEQAQRKLLTRRPQTGRPKPRHTKRCYPLKGALWCDICERKMQAHHSGHATYYRCRFPEEYGLANKIAHPRNVYVREDHLLPGLDRWLGIVLAPHRIKETITAMQHAQGPAPADSAAARARDKIKQCAVKLDRHRAALEAGGDSAAIARWIARTEAAQAAAEQELREAQKRKSPLLGEEEITALVRKMDDLRTIIPSADPKDKEKLYAGLGLKMTYCPGRDEVRAEITFNPDHIGYRGVTDRVRGGTHTVSPNVIPLSAALPFVAA